MGNNGFIKKSISLPIHLWNLVPKTELDNFSKFAQDAIRLKLKSMKTQNIREFIDSLDKKELEILRSELVKK